MKKALVGTVLSCFNHKAEAIGWNLSLDVRYCVKTDSVGRPKRLSGIMIQLPSKKRSALCPGRKNS